MSVARGLDPAPEPAASGRSGDGFRRLFDGHFDYVWSSLRRCGVPSADLEDLTHEVFLRVHRQLAAYDEARPLRPWLFGFVFRVARDFRKLARHRYEVQGAQHGDAVDPVPAADEQLIALDRKALVKEALDMLDFEHRALIVGHEIEGHPVPELATALNVPMFTAYSRLRVAREKLGAAVRRLQVQRGER